MNIQKLDDFTTVKAVQRGLIPLGALREELPNYLVHCHGSPVETFLPLCTDVTFFCCCRACLFTAQTNVWFLPGKGFERLCGDISDASLEPQGKSIAPTSRRARLNGFFVPFFFFVMTPPPLCISLSLLSYLHFICVFKIFLLAICCIYGERLGQKSVFKQNPNFDPNRAFKRSSADIRIGG